MSFKPFIALSTIVGGAGVLVLVLTALVGLIIGFDEWAKYTAGAGLFLVALAVVEIIMYQIVEFHSERTN